MDEVADVDGMIDPLMDREDGFVDHPIDKGGPTCFASPLPGVPAAPPGRCSSRGARHFLDPMRCDASSLGERRLAPGPFDQLIELNRLLGQVSA